MKKIAVFALCLIALSSQAQEDNSSSSSKTNEIKINFLNVIALSSIEVGYERFMGDDQSLGFDLMINDRFSYYPEGGSQRKKFDTSSAAISYNFYFSSADQGIGYYITPFFKYRFGKYSGPFEYTDVLQNKITLSDYKTSISSPIFGLGMGYKWLWADKFTVSASASIARNFNKDVESRFVSIEPNAAINIGYRF